MINEIQVLILHLPSRPCICVQRRGGQQHDTLQVPQELYGTAASPGEDWGLMVYPPTLTFQPIAEVRQRPGDWSDPVYCLPLRIRLWRKDDRRPCWGAHPLWHLLYAHLLRGTRPFMYILQDNDSCTYSFQRVSLQGWGTWFLYLLTEYLMNVLALLWSNNFLWPVDLIRPLGARAASSHVRRVLQLLQTTPVEATLGGSVSTSEFAMLGNEEFPAMT